MTNQEALDDINKTVKRANESLEAIKEVSRKADDMLADMQASLDRRYGPKQQPVATQKVRTTTQYRSWLHSLFSLFFPS